MRVAIYADSGAAVGMGHVTRCGAIANAARSMGHEARFYDNMGADAFIEAALEYRADCALVDSYLWTAECYDKVKAALFTVVIDDNARLPYAADILINANLYAPDLDYSSCKAQNKLLGGRYALLRGLFRVTPPAAFKRALERVLVTMGGADTNGYTPVVLKGLADIDGIEILAVMGPLAKCGDEVKSAAKGCKSKVTILRGPDNMAEIMASCDMAVSSAGTTVYELCALGVPSILIGQADNQDRICDYFKRTGYMQVLGNHKDAGPRGIGRAAKLYINSPDIREKARQDLLTLVDRNGAENIVNSILASLRERL